MPYVPSGSPAYRSGPSGTSAAMRAEFVLIQTETDKLSKYTANGGLFLRVNAGGTAYEAISVATALASLVPNSAALAAAVGDETGTGALVFATSPVLVTPALGTPASGVATNLTGTAAGLTSGNVTTNASLTGHVTSVGNAAVLGSFTSAQLATALTDETGTGAAVFANTPTIATPVINGLPTGTGIATANTVSTLVSRDASGNFAAGTISAALNGNAASATTATNATNATAATNQSGGTVNATTGSFSGEITSTVTSNRFLTAISSIASELYVDIRNTTGLLVIGVERSPGGMIIIGSAASDAVIKSLNGISFSVDNGASLGARLSTSGLATKYGITSSSPTQGIGYAAGAGGTVTQITSNITAVTIDKICGQVVTLAGGSFPANSLTTFTVYNSTVGTYDMPVVTQRISSSQLIVYTSSSGAGFFNISVFNTSTLVSGQINLIFSVKPNVIA